ncbi:exopolyphosphatase / guanosine-5'-triphosphate,3'-diphosphate pyrophosphatase [Klebsormidium nitens]|uniref:Exopolyphosphatase / guanosine-5'-triphosphate,3'-diphosphate pyrophosphatase n=1 Tax=Klebsormidium nitens TaxID=105231 RepID=A0A1Y1IJA0_KLENI|nr:exopolyphosphatase / guanosine-5'-triphosphate,3'-diphosphate pyrophosphatase [Klebsormidium nitens]|eukprot:GAQ88727.1 exopolyphosphatase / guanosine-5'-triphosphate,3'-diphosphate pyrophosphatase [Klebsormidium nitens]
MALTKSVCGSRGIESLCTARLESQARRVTLCCLPFQAIPKPQGRPPGPRHSSRSSSSYNRQHSQPQQLPKSTSFIRNVKVCASSKGGSNGHVDSANAEQKDQGEGGESTNGEGNGRGPIYVEDGDRPPPGLAAAARQQSEPQIEPDGDHKMLAAVDMGTNSFHMVIVRADAKGRFQIVDVEKDDVRLGKGSMGFSIIHPDAEERAIAAMRRFQKIAKTRNASMRVVATSAVREAKNRRTYIRRVKEETGIDVEILSGKEEACLIYLGVLQALPVFEKTVLTVDIGGGSTEFVVGRQGEPLYATSLKLGHVRLTEQFLGSGNEPLQRSQIDDLRRHVRIMLADSGVLDAVSNRHFDVAIGSSGTIETIAEMIHANVEPEGVEGTEVDKKVADKKGRQFKEEEFTKEQLQAVVKKILKAKTNDQRAKIPGLQKQRADVIVGGAILLEEIFEAMNIDKMKVSPYALREGVIVDTLSQTIENFNQTPDIRRASILNLAARFNTDRRMDSAIHSADLAKQILWGMQTCRTGSQDCCTELALSLDDNDCFLMEAATMLHYVGMFVSHTGYHKHSYYLIKNNEHLLGFSPMEIEVIALLTRYHRKKVPSSKHEAFAELPPEIQTKFKAMCAIMRVAVALDRCDSSTVERVTVLQDLQSCVLAVTPKVDPDTGKAKDVSLEVWAATAELEFFNKVFKKTASIVIADMHDADQLDIEVSKSLSS